MWTALIVEDDINCSELLEMVLLAIPGLAIRSVSTAAEALRLLTSGDAYTLLITDVHLRGEDGLSLVEAMRKIPNRAALPVLVMTSSRDVSVRERAGAMGIAGFIEKPYSPARIVKP